VKFSSCILVISSKNRFSLSLYLSLKYGNYLCFFAINMGLENALNLLAGYNFLAHNTSGRAH